MSHSKKSFVRNGRIAIALLASILLFVTLAVIVILSQQKSIAIERAAEEADHDLEFVSNMIKSSYLSDDFTGVERILNDWTRDNNIDSEVEVVANNGYLFFSRQIKQDVAHTYPVEKEIMHDGRLLLKLIIIRDIGDVMINYYTTRNRVIISSMAVVFILVVTFWSTIKYLIINPIIIEIDRRISTESELRLLHKELEDRINERTSDLTRANTNLKKIISKKNEAVLQMYKLSSAIEQTDDLVVIADKDGLVEYVNPSFEKTTGYMLEEIVGKKSNFMQSPMHDEQFNKNLWETINAGKSYNDVFINCRKDGGVYYEEKTITPLFDDKGEIQNFVATGKDITERIKVQDRLQYLATHDILTGLPNRVMLRDRIIHSIDQVDRQDKKVAILFLDLDRFKMINDSLGHTTGDNLLKMVSRKLSKCIRKSDSIARFGGDEFTIVMENITNIDHVTDVAYKINKALSTPMTVDGYEIMTGTSIGITVYPDDGGNVDDLLKNADTAMYRAKANGGNCYQFYTKDMTEHAVTRLAMQNRLSQALKKREFELHYQPRISLETGQVCGLEALLRWNSSSDGLVMPDVFISLLEQSDQIIHVGNWVIEQAFEFSQHLKSKGFDSVRVSINLSARQFRDKSTLKKFTELQQSCDAFHGCLEVEITESLLVENIAMAAGIMDNLHAMGVTISVDDFGTGYSSMSYLKQFPIDALKIDKSFVTDTPDDADDVSIVTAVVALAKGLAMQSVAEGVETMEQLNLLKDMQCDEVQGFLFSQALPANEILDWLADFDMGKYAESA